MNSFELFPNDSIVGVFHGFSEGGLEFHADLILPYKNEFQNVPMHGQFLLVQLETPMEGVLGRITSLSSAGRLASGIGEEFNIRAVREGRPIPEELREQYLKYRVDIRVLGIVRQTGTGKLTFVASHRRLPHVGSPVAFLSAPVLQEMIGHNIQGAAIGHYALGEYVYADRSGLIDTPDWMQIKQPEALVKFPIHHLVSRRTFIFARAGFGKSNLNKLLFSELYRDDPKVAKRNTMVPVGTLIFDPDGEYFWPDDKGRPALCDVRHLEQKLVVFTNREGPSPFYSSFVAGGIRLDIRRLKPSDVISLSLSPERQDQQNVRKLRGLRQDQWEELVDLIDGEGNQAPLEEIKRILSLEATQDAEALAARGNVTAIVQMIHDKSSQLMDRLIQALADGKLCVIDVSQLRGTQALILSSLILRRIFERNQLEFTKANPRTIPTIVVVEEAQSVLDNRASAAEPYIAWVKEGRKYDLGAVLITQQPGSIPHEILSQGDNWFIFHLLSSGDLASVQRANSHFSDDILSSLLNEPIAGHGVFWSSAGQTPFPISLRALSFERMYPRRDCDYSAAAASTYADALRKQFEEQLSGSPSPSLNGSAPVPGPANRSDAGATGEAGEERDVLNLVRQRAVEKFTAEVRNLEKLQNGTGMPWRGVMEELKRHLPATMDDLDQVAYRLVRDAMVQAAAKTGKQWESYRNDRNTTYVRLI